MPASWRHLFLLTHKLKFIYAYFILCSLIDLWVNTQSVLKMSNALLRAAPRLHMVLLVHACTRDHHIDWSIYFVGEIHLYSSCLLAFQIRLYSCLLDNFFVQCTRPCGPQALDTSKFSARALDLSYFTCQNKCTFINLRWEITHL